MRTNWQWALAAIAITAAAQAATPAWAQAPMSKAQIAAEQIEVDAGIGWIDYLLERTGKGDMIVATRAENDPDFDSVSLYLPVNRDDLIRAAQRSVYEGELSSGEAAALLIALGRRSAEKVRGLRTRRAELVLRRSELTALMARPAPARPTLQPWETGRPPAPRQETQASAGGCQGFVGTWNTNYGPMWIGGAEGAINGSYEWTGAGGHRTDTLSGSVSGNTATGTFSQPGYYDPQWASGRFTFTLSSDGQSWSGSGTNANGSASMGWNGTCAGAPAPRVYDGVPKN